MSDLSPRPCGELKEVLFFIAYRNKLSTTLLFAFHFSTLSLKEQKKKLNEFEAMNLMLHKKRKIKMLLMTRWRVKRRKNVS